MKTVKIYLKPGLKLKNPKNICKWVGAGAEVYKCTAEYFDGVQRANFRELPRRAIAIVVGVDDRWGIRFPCCSHDNLVISLNWMLGLRDT